MKAVKVLALLQRPMKADLRLDGASKKPVRSSRWLDLNRSLQLVRRLLIDTSSRGCECDIGVILLDNNTTHNKAGDRLFVPRGCCFSDREGRRDWGYHSASGLCTGGAAACHDQICCLFGVLSVTLDRRGSEPGKFLGSGFDHSLLSHFQQIMKTLAAICTFVHVCSELGACALRANCRRFILLRLVFCFIWNTHTHTLLLYVLFEKTKFLAIAYLGKTAIDFCFELANRSYSECQAMCFY
jgi:hypothetical protein